MRLKQIKLAGFKSFVDPTKVPFPDRMTAILGPNGCGKSNIIDAVRWVLGESSAKNLRGDAMADVIFNGSTGRKPVSVASVELVFDNQGSRLKGEYAGFAEVAVKRQVSRDGQSNYYLNGNKCRRRDITDLFMGTGLGPRSYAIIEQGMISRLIESKPQDLRVFIEEAAGISRYKERRRETENRIRHTRENLERLTDVRDELGRQIERLERQAEAAARYRELKAEERKLSTELVALKWRGLSAQMSEHQHAIDALELEKLQCEQSLVKEQASFTLIEQEGAELGVEIDDQRERLAQIGNDITRIEQQILHRRQRHQQLKESVARYQGQGDAAQQQLADLQQKQLMLSESLESLLPEREIMAEQILLLQDELDQVEVELEQKQQHYLDSTSKAAEMKQQLQVVLTRETSCRQELERTKGQRERISRQLQEFKQDELQSQSIDNRNQLCAAESELSKDLQQLEQQQLIVADAEVKATKASSDAELLLEGFNQARLHHHTLVTTIAARQSEATGESVELPRVWEQSSVSAPWALAVEQVLSGQLQGVMTEEHSDDAKGLFCFSTDLKDTSSSSQDHYPWPKLADQVNCAVNLSPWLEHIYCADSLHQAKSWLEGAPRHVSFVLKDGTWLGEGFIREPGDTVAEPLTELGRRREQAQLELESAKQQYEHNQQLRSQLDEELKQAKQQLNQLDVNLRQSQQQVTELNRDKQRLDSELGQVELQQQLLDGQQQELLERTEELVEQSEQLQQQIVDLEQQAERQVSQVEQSNDGIEQFKAQAKALRQQLQQQQTKQHQLQLDIQKQQAESQGLHQQQTQAEQSLRQWRLQTQQAEDELQSLMEPIDDEEAQLAQLLAERSTQDEVLRQGQTKQQQLDEQLKEMQHHGHELQKQIQQLDQNLSSHRLAHEGLRVQAQGQLDLLAETQSDLDEVIAALSPDAAENQWQQQLHRIKERIKRLGAINMAAIDEHQQQLTRKTYLDEQDKDLNEALAVLESAIRRIDRETRQRFKETFDRVNADIAALFPKVFGGGSAYLALTGEDLLDTGVTIMARPPGKKNSTIHLLSGGEKALTALSLVFAIFRLNPAPFCMLDEVDAPLDDANVARFCRLVKEMSETVQFIFISHNKVSMEMAERLIGVTMHEPGVSRIVAVDMEEATAMALIE